MLVTNFYWIKFQVTKPRENTPQLYQVFFSTSLSAKLALETNGSMLIDLYQMYFNGNLQFIKLIALGIKLKHFSDQNNLFFSKRNISI